MNPVPFTVISSIDRLRQAKENRESHTGVFSEMSIRETSYLVFLYEQIFLANLCSEQQFIDVVEAMNETVIQLITGAEHASRFGCKEELAGYVEGIKKEKVIYLDEFLLCIRNSR